MSAQAKAIPLQPPRPARRTPNLELCAQPDPSPEPEDCLNAEECLIEDDFEDECPSGPPPPPRRDSHTRIVVQPASEQEEPIEVIELDELDPDVTEITPPTQPPRPAPPRPRTQQSRAPVCATEAVRRCREIVRSAVSGQVRKGEPEIKARFVVLTQALLNTHPELVRLRAKPARDKDDNDRIRSLDAVESYLQGEILQMFGERAAKWWLGTVAGKIELNQAVQLDSLFSKTLDALFDETK